MQNSQYYAHPQAAFPDDLDKPQVWKPTLAPAQPQAAPQPMDFSQYGQQNWAGPIGGNAGGVGGQQQLPPQHQQIRQRQSPGTRGLSMGSSDASFSSALLSNPLAQAAMHAYGAQVQQQMSGLFSLLNAHRLKYYFHVNNAYVLHKLYILLLPFLHKSWKRQTADPLNSASDSLEPQLYAQPAAGAYRPPSEDVNAPDLYIPCMAFFTYIIMMSYAYASTHAASTFDPELIGVLASSTLVMLVLEAAVLRLGLYLISADSIPHILDLVAFISYKYVHAVLILLLCLLSDSALLYYCAILVLGGLHGLFMMRTMKRAMTPVIDAQTLAGQGAASTMRSNYFLLVVGVLQIVIVAFLVKGAV